MSHQSKTRNIAIIAHVDHGKTTLVDQLLKQSGTFRENEEVADRVMDSMDLEKERGITISAKNCSLAWGENHVNIVDTPGHADFGGEVERSLMMVDGAILLVDAAEGPLPQTRFVLQKALARGIKMILVINKVDRPDARIDEVVEEVQDLFLDLATDDDHLEFPTLYASGRDGWASREKDLKKETLDDLMDVVFETVPPPKVSEEGAPLLLVNNLSYSSYLGRLAIGRLEQGVLKSGQPIKIIGKEKPIQAKVVKMMTWRGLDHQEAEEVKAGDIVIIAPGLDDISIGDTVTSLENDKALPRIEVDPPTVSVEVSVNTSPLAGREGEYLTSRKLLEFLKKEELYNVSLRIDETETSEIFILNARGELQVSVIMENLRRAGGEVMLGRPKVVTVEKDGEIQEPMEHVVVDVPSESVGAVTEKLQTRKGIMTHMEAFENGRTRIEFDIPSRGLLGYRSTFLTDTRGEGILASYVTGYDTYRGDMGARNNGALIADRPGTSTQYALFGLESRGRLFIPEGMTVYEGMIIGEHSRDNDLDVNAIREKKLTNMRSAGTDDSTKLSPISKMDLERALDWIDDDEWIEITPENVRIRKRTLQANMRGKPKKNKEK